MITQELKKICETCTKEGYEKGYKKGYNEGYNEGRKIGSKAGYDMGWISREEEIIEIIRHVEGTDIEKIIERIKGIRYVTKNCNRK